MILVLACAVAGLVITQRITSVPGTGSVNSLAERAYGPQPDRTAEWVGDPTGPMSQDVIDKIARNAGIEVLPKFAAGYSIAAHFDEARRLMAAADHFGNDHLKVFEYFSASFWFDQNATEWGSYGKEFQSSWLLRDNNGAPIPFYGAGNPRDEGGDPVGYLIDLRNPDYRAWAVRTIVAWMGSAPYAGVAFDSANPLLDSASVRASLGNSDAESYSSLLCGAQVPGCSAVSDWNAGLADLVRATTEALKPMGKQTLYNGIAPSPQRGQDRNVGLLADSDATSNEDFCVQVTDTQTLATSITADISLMKQISAQGKTVVEMTNYRETDPGPLGEYCLAAFLMGWQPGSSYYVFHANYADPLDGAYPQVPEQNLQLGAPTAQFAARDSVLTRSFAHGFVAVNTGNSSQRVRIPVTGVQFANGVAGVRLSAGDQVTLPGHSALYVLSRTYLCATGCGR